MRKTFRKERYKFCDHKLFCKQTPLAETNNADPWWEMPPPCVCTGNTQDLLIVNPFSIHSTFLFRLVAVREKRMPFALFAVQGKLVTVIRVFPCLLYSSSIII